MKVVFSEESRADLLSIGDRIAPDNSSRAESFVREIVDACMLLRFNPRAHSRIPRYEHWGLRRKVFGRYLIIYRVYPDLVLIVRIVHGAMDIDGILNPPQP